MKALKITTDGNKCFVEWVNENMADTADGPFDTIDEAVKAASLQWAQFTGTHGPALMNSRTCTVQTEDDWREDYANMSLEEWGGPDFEDAELVEVQPDFDGGWEEAQ